MTQEEKAKAYDEVREKIAIRFGSNVAEEIFSQFEMSEDERIRKGIIRCIKGNMPDNDFRKKYIAWLEKTSDKIVEKARTEKQRVLLTETDGSANIDWDCRSLDDVKILLKCGLEFIRTIEADKQILTDNRFGGCSFRVLSRYDKDIKQGEQKPADKFETNFNVGDWIVCIGDVQQILSIDANGVCFVSGKRVKNKYISNYHLWTIQDAKDGDVLADDYGIYIFDRFDEYDEKCFLCMGAYQYSQKVYENGHLLCSVEVHPATKEQRDLLFKKMKEAGYEWDADKKELKKIAWSEEDEINLEKTIWYVENPAPKIVKDSMLVEWLKSLKDRYTWKPSEREIQSIRDCALNKNIDADTRLVLDAFYQDLKKLIKE